MTDPARLLNSTLDVESRRAIEAAIMDEPPHGAKSQLWGTIVLALPAAGVLLGATTTSSATAATAAAANETAAMAAPVAAATVMGSSSLGMLAGKAIAIGLGVGLAFNVAGGAATHLLGAKSAAAVSVVTAVPSATGVHSTARAVPERLEPKGSPVRVTEAVFPAVTARNTPPTTATRQLTADELTADELREESALLVRTREALNAAQAARALELIAEHRQGFGGGKLVQERDALEVQALAKAGQLAAAQARAKAFLLRYPESPHAEKIRAIIGESGEQAQDR